ncbi:UNVERIFIED_CONTAM: hypothetical protein Sindi_2298000 [Sesamum indicum]
MRACSNSSSRREGQNQLTRPLWLAEEIWRQLLEFFPVQNFKHSQPKISQPGSKSRTVVTVYHGGSSSVRSHKQNMVNGGVREGLQKEGGQPIERSEGGGDCGSMALDEQQVAGRGAEYSAMTTRPTTRFLDRHRRPSRPCSLALATTATAPRHR